MLIPNWRQAGRWWSVRVSALGSILYAAMILIPDQLLDLWNMMPGEIRELVPSRTWVSLILFVLVIVARLVPQREPSRAGGLWASNSGKVKPKAGIAAAAIAMIASVIAVEGGWVHHPADPGGETNMGITKRVAVQNGYVGPMRTLPRSVAESIYYQRYLVEPGYAPLIAIDAAVTEELFDTTVNMGPARPSRWFQVSINAICSGRLAVDGRVGPGTIAAYRACQGRIGASRLCVAMLDALDARQRAEYDRLVRANARLKVFHRGWVAHRIGNVDRRRCRVPA